MDVPLLEDEEIRQTSAAPADIESGLSGDRAGSEAGASNKTEEDRQIEEVWFVVLASLSDVDAGIDFGVAVALCKPTLCCVAAGCQGLVPVWSSSLLYRHLQASHLLLGYCC